MPQLDILQDATAHGETSKTGSFTKIDTSAPRSLWRVKDGTLSKTLPCKKDCRNCRLVLMVPTSITFERIPSDYAILKIVIPPEDVGGDTLWASGYEAYDRLSPVWKKFAEGLTATHYQPNFNKVSQEFGEELIDTDRGAPDNSGLDFQASQ